MAETREVVGTPVVLQPSSSNTQAAQAAQENGKGGMFVYVIELAQKLPPLLFAMIIVIGAALLMRDDMKEAVSKLVTTIEKTERDRAEAMKEAHRDAAVREEQRRQTDQRQWESLKDMQRESQAANKAVESRLTELIQETKKRPPGG